MNTEHKDIQKIVPYGEQLRGFANQKFISSSEIHRILKERGIFLLNQEKDFTVPILQMLLLSPSEFDKIREAFSQKEDNKKVISRDIQWIQNTQLFSTDLLSIDVNDFIKKELPTCSLKQPIRLIQVEKNPNHLRAEFVIERRDLNKSWYEQTNEFVGTIEFINENNGKGRVIISHTAPETKEIAEFAVKSQIQRYKSKGLIATEEKLRKICFNDFSNEERFVFFFRLTNHIECDFFKCEDIKNISIKPEETSLPDDIKWMEDVNKILLSGRSLDKKFFIRDVHYHKHIVLWDMEASYLYEYKGQKGALTVSFGFPDYKSGKNDSSEFELNIATLTPEAAVDTKTRRELKKQLLLEMDKQKSVVYNNFLDYKNNKELRND
jgi:hypothetical protein